jgi:hypothetical protein
VLASSLRLRSSGHESVLLEDLLDPPRAGDADALIDRKCLPEVLGGLVGVARLKVAVAESFQGAPFLKDQPEITCNG